VLADPAHMEQLVLNLVINARDAMPRGGVITIRSANVPAAAPRSGGGGRDRVALSVSDTGIGMAPDIAERIFEPFFTTKREGRGTGLGLSIVENIVAAHGGEVRVESAPGRGACFTVILPRADGDDRRGESQAAPAPPVGGHETVLVVDDDDLVRRAIQQVLVRHGYRVLLASNGGDALLRFEQEKERIRLLVTDVVMPQMRGSELARRVREQAPHLPVVFMSGYTEEELDGAADLHHGQLLHKPFEPHRFLTVVRELLDAASH
jgi:CheY-like chemotaxis protein